MAAQDDLESLTSLAERLGLDEKQGSKFVNESMQRLGYKPRMEWEDGEPEGDGGDGGGSFFGGKREQRPVGGNREQQRSRGGSGWQYDG